MNARLISILAVALAACSSEVPAPAPNGSGAGGAGGSPRVDGAGGVAFDGGDSSVAGTGGGGSSEAGRDSGASADAAPDVDSSGPVLADARDAKLDAAVEAAPQDARADAVVRLPSFIVVLGSSTAAGFGLTDPATSWVQRYVAYLSANVPGSKVTNLAVSGYTTYQIQPTGTMNPSGQPAVDPAHNVTAALALHPDAIIVNMPSNDANAGISVDATMNNLKTVAGKATDANVLIWVSTTQPRQLPPSGIALLIGVRDRTKQEFGDRALDFFTPLAAADGTPLPMYNQGDGIHPNAEGHRLLFEQVRAADLPAVLARTGKGARD